MLLAPTPHSQRLILKGHCVLLKRNSRIRYVIVARSFVCEVSIIRVTRALG